MRDWLSQGEEPVVNLDKLSYAGNLDNLSGFKDDARHTFVHGDIGDIALLARLLREHRVRAVLNFAAETHVDRSIDSPAAFVDNNVTATFGLLEAVRAYWHTLEGAACAYFRFLHVSTDEVYGSPAPEAPAFAETHRYQPNCP